jgi:hypothetical protein
VTTWFALRDYPLVGSNSATSHDAMSLFDPSWRKAIDKSPGWFRQAALRWDPSLVAFLNAHGVPDSGLGMCRSVVNGCLGLHMAELTNQWSVEALRYMHNDGRNAFRALPQRSEMGLFLYQGALKLAPAALLSIAYPMAGRELHLSSNPLSEDTPTILPDADNPAAAIAACALHFAEGYVGVDWIEGEQRGERWFARVRLSGDLGKYSVVTMYFDLAQEPPGEELKRYVSITTPYLRFMF